MKKENLPDIIPDNDEHYFNSLEKIIKEIDPEASLTAKPSIEGLVIHILPSILLIREEMVKIIRRYHYDLNLKIEFSKSLLISKYITFKVKIW